MTANYPCVWAVHTVFFISTENFGEGFKLLKGEGGGGVPWVQILENELEYLADRGGHGGHLGEKFVKKYCS